LDLQVVHGIRDFFQEITHPGMLLAMGVGSAAFRAGKLGAQWGFSPGTGWGGRLGTSLFGLVTESLAFTGVGQGYARVFEGAPELSAGEWARQWGTAAMLLGSLRGAGAGALGLGRWIHGEALLKSKFLLPFYQQAGMYGGIVTGHGILEDVDTPQSHLLRSLAYLIQFNAGAILARRTLGPYLEPLETAMEARSRRLQTADLFESNMVSASGVQIYQNRAWKFPSLAGHDNLHPTFMGVAPARTEPVEGNFSTTVRLAQQGKLKELVSNGRVSAEKVAEDVWLSDFLTAHEISTHPFDLKMFRAGFTIGHKNPEWAHRMAWDVDEVQLHWAVNPVDAFRGLFQGRNPASFQNTPKEFLNYDRFEAHPELRLPLVQRLWYEGLQRVAPSRMRQTIQFHPGGRAFLLGMRSSILEPLTLVTTGPAGRLLILVNEDPALKRIFFGKGPAEPVTMEEIRGARHIYTREDLVQAMRILSKEETGFLQDPLVQDYVRRIQMFPRQGHKLKHPALARILKKRSFDVLVDDSASTYRMLKDLPGFTVFKMASARPPLTLNLALGSRRRYLDRMANGVFDELARQLENPVDYHSREISGGDLPAKYPKQRFSIEMPWDRFHNEFALPGAELDYLSGKIAGKVLPRASESAGETYVLEGGMYRFRRPGRKVVVFGDNGWGRIYELAKEGHQPLLIDWDPEVMRMGQRFFRRANNRDIHKGVLNREVFAQWVEGDWYKTSASADAIEVFFPFSGSYNFILGERYAKGYVRRFMEDALHTKLKSEGGTVYLLTEVDALVRQMHEIVQENPKLELLDINMADTKPPILGGHVTAPGTLEEVSSWILYRKKPR
jgi:hypothetical protein